MATGDLSDQPNNKTADLKDFETAANLAPESAQLKDDEALLVESDYPERCEYASLLLTNDIFETTDWYNNHSSLNGAQWHVDADNRLRVIVSAKDPGVQNWLDTAGYRTGVVKGRWTE